MVRKNSQQDGEVRSRSSTGRALAGVRVVEYAEFVAAPYCAELLADLGAEVIKIERPGNGDEARRWGPFPGDVPHAEKSGLFLYLNTNKLGITLNPQTASGQEIFKSLIETSDILVHDRAPGVMERLGLGYSDLSEVNPKLVVTSITPFGENGPCSGYKAYYLNTYHSGMLGYITPIGSARPEREPLRGGGLVGEYACGLTAVVGTLGALYWQRSQGQGQHVEVSKQEALVGYGRVNASSFANGVTIPTRTIRLPGRGGMMPCRDGHVCVHVPQDSQWAGLVKLMGRPDWATDEKYSTTAGRILYLSEIIPLIREWTSTRTKEEIYHPAQKLGSTVTPVMTAQEVVDSRQSEARGFFSEIDHLEAGKFRYPGSPFLFSRTPPAVVKAAPLLGEHNEEIYIGRLGYDQRELVMMMQAGVI